MVGVPVPAQEEPTAQTEPQPEVPEAEPQHEVSTAPNGTRVEVVEHHTPAQLNPDPVFVAFARTALSVLNREASPQQAALDMRHHLDELEFRLAQTRRQSRNRVEAEAMAAGLRVSHETGTIPAEGTDAFDRLAAQQAATMKQRALHTVADPAETGVFPVIKLDEPIPAPAPSYTGRVTAGGVVHRQDPLEDVAFPACVLDEEQRERLLADVHTGTLVFLPTQRAVTCPQLACTSAAGTESPVGDDAGSDEAEAPVVEVSTMPVSGPLFPPMTEATEPESPVHQGDDVEPAVPAEGKPAVQTLPRRQKPKSAEPDSGAHKDPEAAQ